VIEKSGVKRFHMKLLRAAIFQGVSAEKAADEKLAAAEKTAADDLASIEKAAAEKEDSERLAPHREHLAPAPPVTLPPLSLSLSAPCPCARGSPPPSTRLVRCGGSIAAASIVRAAGSLRGCTFCAVCLFPEFRA